MRIPASGTVPVRLPPQHLVFSGYRRTVAPSASSKCRVYATASVTRYTFFGMNGYNTSTTESQSCAFNSATRVRQCAVTVNGDSTCNQAKSTTYIEAADFVEEAAALGRERFDTLEIVSSGPQGCASTQTNVYSYDAQRRPVRLQEDYSVGDKTYPSSTTFGAWDTMGRPTEKTTVQNYNGGCGGTATTEYNDAARTVTSYGTGCYSSEYVLTRTYDANGILVNEETRRVYPQGELAASLLGFVSYAAAEEAGEYGIEKYYEDILKGARGFFAGDRDAAGFWVSIGKRVFDPPENGESVVLTIDRNVQFR